VFFGVYFSLREKEFKKQSLNKSVKSGVALN
jgi:hypothetical protein